jgi:Flp pilus assembly pilin Flp
MTVDTFLRNASRLGRQDEGQTMAEYGVVLGVIVIGVIATIGVLSVAFQATLEDVASLLRSIVVP